MANELFSIINPRIISWVLILFYGFSFILKSQNPEWIIYNTSNSLLPDNFIQSITIDNENNKWFCTGGGLVKFVNDSTWTIYTMENSGLPSNIIKTIAIDSKNNKWLGFNKKGVARFDDKNWTFYNKFNSKMTDNEIETISIDKNDNIWVGTVFGGINKFDGNSNWTIYDTSNTIIPYLHIRGIDFDNEGNTWISTFESLIKFDGDTSWHFADVSKIISHWSVNIYSIKFDKNYNLWLGNNNFISKFDRDTSWTLFQNKFTSGYHYTLAFDNENNLWFGSSLLDTINLVFIDAIVKFDGNNSWTVFSSNDSPLPKGRIHSIAIDKYGNKWMGTFGGGVAVYREGGVVGVKDILKDEKTNMSLFPNPVTSSFSLSGIPDGAVSFEIFDIFGERVSSTPSSLRDATPQEGNFNIDVSFLPSGIYFLKLNNQAKPIKFIKL